MAFAFAFFGVLCDMGTRLYVVLLLRTPDPCFEANGLFFLETMGMGDDGRIGIGRPFATPIRCSSHVIVMCWAGKRIKTGGGVKKTPIRSARGKYCLYW